MTDILPYLDAAAAHPDFKAEVLAYLGGKETSRIVVERHAPRVKVERVLTQLLATHPSLPIERVRVRGEAGCSDFTGELSVQTADAEHRVSFTWCCAWKAEQMGWRDYFGFWDQTRAAREFGYDCFSRWDTVTIAPVQLGTAAPA